MRIWNTCNSTRKQKLDPDAPSEITLMLDLDESEVKMVFQCILGLDYQVNAVSETLRRLSHYHLLG